MSEESEGRRERSRRDASKPKPWKTLTSRVVYQNPWIRVREDCAQRPDGSTTPYGVIETKPAVGVLPVTRDGTVWMVRQYRYALAEDHRWEIPTGAVEPGESSTEAARRELREEVGHDAGRLEPICEFYSSKSVMAERCELFLGFDLTPAPEVGDDTAYLEAAVFPFDEVLQMVLSSEIRDAMSVIAILHAARLAEVPDAADSWYL